MILLPPPQHQDGVWIQADEEQQVHRFPHFSNFMHYVQRDGGRQGPIGQVVCDGVGPRGKNLPLASRWSTFTCCTSTLVNAGVWNPLSVQKQFHSQIDDLIEESVKDMIQLLVAKVKKEEEEEKTNKQTNNFMNLTLNLSTFVCFFPVCCDSGRCVGKDLQIRWRHSLLFIPVFHSETKLFFFFLMNSWSL